MFLWSLGWKASAYVGTEIADSERCGSWNCTSQREQSHTQRH